MSVTELDVKDTNYNIKLRYRDREVTTFGITKVLKCRHNVTKVGRFEDIP
jgi:hypothetical protein